MRPPRKLAPVLLLAAVLLAGCADGDDQPGNAATDPPADGVTEVVARDSRFSPAAIQVPAGTEVTWSFDVGLVPHNVVGDGWGSEEPQRSGPSGTPSTGPAPTPTNAPCTPA